MFKNFLHFANEQLNQSEEKEAAGSQEDESKKSTRLNRIDRITSSILQALSHSFRFIETWSQEDKDLYNRKVVSILGLEAD